MSQRQDMIKRMGGPLTEWDRTRNEYNIIPGFPQWAWPGGYELFFIMDDGEELCVPCANDSNNPVHFEDEDGSFDGWMIQNVAHVGEFDGPVSCSHCGRVLLEDDENGE